jgi:hypothetical protein
LLSFDQLSLKSRKVVNAQGLKFVKRNEQFSATRCQLRIPLALKFGNKLALTRDTKRAGYDVALSLLQLLLQHGCVLPLRVILSPYKQAKITAAGFVSELQKFSALRANRGAYLGKICAAVRVRRIDSFDGARGNPSDEPFIAAPGFNINVVNRPAPDLFPVMNLVKKQCTRNETKRRGRLWPEGEHGCKPLKSNRIIYR